MGDSNEKKIENPEAFGKVAVLMGGWSAEREISMLSGMAVFDALQRQSINAVAVDVDRQILQVLVEGDFDRAFIVLHGRGGEDGVIQGALETLGMPYTGSGVMGSAISMDKLRCKQIWQGAGLPTPDYAVLGETSDVTAVIDRLGLPLIVKPAHEGSSLGMNKVTQADELQDAWQQAAQLDDLVMAERWISGTEYTASILDGQALPLIRLETPRSFYDYAAKYEADTTRYICPCGLDAAAETALQQLALEAFDVVGAAGWGRVDLFVDEDNRPWLIEVNTVPGMTDHSLVPMAAKQAGIDFDELVWRILETSTTKH